MTESVADVTGQQTTAPDHTAHAHPDGHPPHLAHHFDSADQQFDSGKLGMWLFLGTEILLFGGLFCAYAVYRANHPEIFEWGHHFLSRFWGAINTVILICSSFTMAWAVRCAQKGRRRGLVVLLTITFLCGAGFMCVKYVEYESKWKHGLLWGKQFRPDEHYVAAHFGLPTAGSEAAAPAEPAAGDPEIGKKLFLGTCASCHGPEGEGLPGQGKPLLGNEFVRSKSDDELLAFIKRGRQPFEPENTTGVAMPPRGGNPALTDDKLRHVIAFLRILQEKPAPPAPGAVAAADQTAGAPADGQGGEMFIPRSALSPAPTGPQGLALGDHAVEASEKSAEQPRKAHIFFGIYFLMTGLHGLHVLAGMIVIAWLTVRAALGHFGPAYFTPVELGGLYWHLVDLIWIYLFPLLYLIH